MLIGAPWFDPQGDNFTPTASDFAGTAPYGAVLVDAQSGGFYVNRGEPSAPDWQSVYPFTVDRRSLRFQGDVAGKGPIVVDYGEGTFDGTVNPIGCFGYNLETGGNLILAGENGLSLNIEGNYDLGARNDMEVYLQYVSADGLTAKRPLFFAFDRSNNAMTGAFLKGAPLTIQWEDDTTIAAFYQGRLLLPAYTGADSIVEVEGGATTNGVLRMDAATGGGAQLQFQENASNKWWLYKPGADTNLYLRDMTNSRMAWTFGQGNPGTTTCNSHLTFGDALNIAFNGTTGTKIGTSTSDKFAFWNAAPVVQSTGWGSITNVTPDKAFDANATTTDELADVLGTLIAQLVTYGILGA
jgi:hypothetical protein